MTKLRKIAATAILLTLAIATLSCEKNNSEIPQNPNIDINTDGSQTDLSKAGYTISIPKNNDPDDSRHNWEDSVRSVVILAYNAEDIDPQRKPRIVYEFNELDLTARTTVIPATDEEIAQEILDFYALVNCIPLLPEYEKFQIPHNQILGLTDSEARYKYNSQTWSELEKIITEQGGFPMTATAPSIPPNQGKPVSVTFSCGRICAKVDVQLQTVDKDFNADVTQRGTPHATIIMRHAVLLRNNRKVSLLNPAQNLVDDFMPPFTSADSLVQQNGINVSYFPKSARYTFYVFPTENRGTVHYPFYKNDQNFAPQLQIFFDFFPDKNYTYSQRYQFVVPVLGGNDEYIAQKLNPNTSYSIDIKVLGLGGAYDQNGNMINYTQRQLQNYKTSTRVENNNLHTTIEIGG